MASQQKQAGAQPEGAVMKSPHLYPAGWGWNSGGRAGHITAEEVREPAMMQRCMPKGESYISCAAGTNHTLLVSDAGQVYALGEGRWGQLGLGNPFTGALRKGGTYQSTPREVTPSGAYKYHADMKISQVAAGATFSVAREVSVEEGLELVEGFGELENAMSFLLERFGESLTLQLIWATVRQERFRINRKSEGQVLVWGSGEYGELGLGYIGKRSLYPQRVWKFRDCCVTSIAAGARHVLAVDSRGRLHSWGCGKGGRLGHGDFEDRAVPVVVAFFGTLLIEQCAAGDAHSAVITIARGGNRALQVRRISCFGRGAHGRLGNGTNRNSALPVLVSSWLPSLKNVRFLQVACGGAHTLALAAHPVPQSIANPRGMETFVCAWGFGTNGQLGTGYRVDSFVPVKARMPRWDVIAEVSAGRSWSMARSVAGEVYTWGKGLRGQLGQGATKFSLAPRKLEAYGSFVRITSGYAHNVCLTVSKRLMSTQLSEALARQQGAAFDPFKPLVQAGLKREQSRSVYTFDCCRRAVPEGQEDRARRRRYACLDCGVPCMCRSCARMCHRTHRVVDMGSRLMEQVAGAGAVGRVKVATPPASEPTKRRAGPPPRRLPIIGAKPAPAPPPPPPPPGSPHGSPPGSPHGKARKKKRRAKKAQATQDTHVDAPLPFYTHALPSYACAIMYLDVSRLRPRKCHLEVMPRLSILDVTHALLHPPTLALAHLGPARKKGFIMEVERRSRESTKEQETDRRLMRVDVALHLPERLRSSSIDSMGSMGSGSVYMGSAEGSVRGSIEGSVRGAHGWGSVDLEGKNEAPVAACRCGLYNHFCRLIPMVPEDPDEDRLHLEERALAKATATAKVASPIGSPRQTSPIGSPRQSKVLLKKQPAKPAAKAKQIQTRGTVHSGERRKGITGRRKGLTDAQRDPEALRVFYLRLTRGVREIAAKRIQKAARKYVVNRIARRGELEFLIMRREVCTSHFENMVMKVVFSKVQQEYAAYRMEVELQTMAEEERLTKAYTYCIDLQQALIGISAISYATRRLADVMAPALPRITARGEVTSHWRSTNAFTLSSVRAQQIALHHCRRVNPAIVAQVTRNLPRTPQRPWGEGQCSDGDLNAFLGRYVRDAKTEGWRFRVKEAIRLEEEMRKAAASAAIARLKARQGAMKRMIQEAEAIALKNAHIAADGPAPPKGPPPRRAVVVAAQAEKAKARRKVEEGVRKEEKLQDAEFSIYEEGFEVKWRPRRHTISDPSQLYSRLGHARQRLQTSNRMKRRNSLPDDIAPLRQTQQPPPLETIASLDNSLELFAERFDRMKRFAQEVNEGEFESDFVDAKPDKFYILQSNKLFSGAPLNPRLPFEMVSMLSKPRRRRSIGEPQRFARQVAMMTDYREAVAELVVKLDEQYKYRRRRRSFDYAEERDRADGVWVAVDMEYEVVGRMGTVTGLAKESLAMERMMVQARMMKATPQSLQAEGMSVEEMSKRFSHQQGTKKGISAKAKPKVKGRRRMVVKKTELEPIVDVAYGGEYGEGYGDYEGALEVYDEVPEDAYDYDSASQLQSWDGGGDEGTVGQWEGEARVWEEHYTEGRAYYFDPLSGESSWELPSAADMYAQIETQNQDAEGNWYWFNGTTEASRWS